MLKTVLRNLVTNAIKFTKNNGHINIYGERNDQCATVIVSDNGIGIDADRLSKLWNFAQKISTSGTANEKGTGLGLMLCKDFVEKQGGKIWVDSEIEKGSDFKFTVPILHI